MNKSIIFSTLLSALLMTSAACAHPTSSYRVDTLMKSLDQVNRFYVPGKSTHAEMLSRLKSMGCHYRSNNRILQEPTDSMTNTFGWFYRLLPEDRGISNCFPVTVFFQNKNGTDVVEIDAGQNLDRDGILFAMKRRWGEPLMTTGRGKEISWLFKAPDRTVILREMGFLRNYEIEIRPVGFYDEVFERVEGEKRRVEELRLAEEREANEAEERRRLKEAEAQRREERMAKAHEMADAHVGRVFGIMTPGETSMELAEVEAEELGCRIDENGDVVRQDKSGSRRPCFSLPDHPRLSIEQFDGGLGFVVRYAKDGEGVAAMRAKLDKSMGEFSAYENRGIVNHYWRDADMTVVETGHHKPGAPINFYFISQETFDKEIARIVHEKEEADEVKRKEALSLEKMF